MLPETEHLGDYTSSNKAQRVYEIPTVAEETNNNNETRDNLDENGFAIARRTPIQNFYAGQTVFITGGTGFLGKILIEKLLRSCREISTIYLLVRSKKDKSAKERIDELLNNSLYDRLREVSPKFHHKIVALSGDCSIPGLGLSSTDRERLIREVSIVFHSAATVSFQEKLNIALAINVTGTSEILNLCKHMDKLKAFIHVSTAYANCHLSTIEETFYPHVTTYEDLGKLLEGLGDREIEEMTPKIINGWPNTYTFTKALAEVLIKERSNGLRAGIFRPAVITSCANEPVKGWIDNLYGPSGVITAAYSGILRSIYLSNDSSANIIPVDFTVNALITSAWDVANHLERKDDKMLIYNYVSTVDHPMTWREYYRINIIHAHQYPLSTTLWPVYISIQTSEMMYTLSTIILHYIPALLIDFSCVCLGQPRRLLKMYKKIHNFIDLLKPFTSNDWTFTNSNVHDMWQRLNAKDQQIFGFHFKDLDWNEYLKDCIKGIRIYLLNDDLSSLEASRKRVRRCFWIADIIKGVLLALILWTLWKIFAAVFF